MISCEIIPDRFKMLLHHHILRTRESLNPLKSDTRIRLEVGETGILVSGFGFGFLAVSLAGLVVIHGSRPMTLWGAIKKVWHRITTT